MKRTLFIVHSFRGLGPMWDKFAKVTDDAVRAISKLDLSREQWIMVSVVVFGIGLVCLKGFGSRTNY